MKTSNIILAGLTIILGFSSCTAKSERPIEGKVKKEIISFTPKVTGRILKIYVSEGETVQKGDTLAMLDVPEVDAKIEQASGVVKATTAQKTLAKNGATSNQRKQLQAKLTAAKEQYGFAQKSFTRAKAMFNDSLIAPQAYDEIFAKYQGAKSQLDAVIAESSEIEKGVRFETQDAAAGQQLQALGVLKEVEVASSERYIIATNNMQIETISLHEGELATAGYALFNGYIPNSTYFRVTIPESHIGNYTLGKQVQLEIRYNQQKYAGKIIAIKQLARYADITAAYPDYQMEEAVYELKIVPETSNTSADLLVNAAVILQK